MFCLGQGGGDEYGETPAVSIWQRYLLAIFVNHCYALAADVLGRDGIPFDVMWPLIDETARKVHRLPAVEAQTGPAVPLRSECDGIAQCAMLDGEPERKALYEMMSQSIHALALRNEAERKETND